MTIHSGTPTLSRPDKATFIRPLLHLLKRLIQILILWPLFLFIFWNLIVRIIRRIYKFPMPHFMANLIDNPLRRRWQPPDQLAERHGLRPGMWVLDIGPGNGTYTLLFKKPAE